jgi:hypothetical protein
VGARKHAHLGGDGPDLVEPPAVVAVVVLQDLAPRDLLAEPFVDGADHRALLRLRLREAGQELRLDRLHAGVGLDLARHLHGLEQRTRHLLLGPRHEPGIEDLGSERPLLLAGLLLQLALHGDDLLDRVVARGQGLEHDVLADLVGARLHHHDRLVGAGHHEVERALGAQLGRGRVDHGLPVPVAHAHGGHGSGERDLGEDEGGAGAGDGEGVGVVLEVGGEEQPDDLRLVVVALREERPQRAVDHARGQDLLLVGPALALEEAAGDLARGVRVLAIVDGEGQEVRARLHVALGVGRRQHDRVPEPHHHRPVRLLGHPPRLEGEGVAAEGHLHTLHGHIFLLRSARGLPLEGPPMMANARIPGDRVGARGSRSCLLCVS